MDYQNEFIRHEPCPFCTSSDAFAVYSDGSGYCFSCGTHRRSEGAKDLFLQQGNTRKSTSMSYAEASETRRVQYDGDFARISSRNITEDTCRKFNVRVDTTRNIIKFPYYSDTGAIVAYKERTKAKGFSWKGKNKDHRLFGQHLFGSGKTIVVVEGELDALATFQARPNWAVVSVDCGAKAAKKSLLSQLDYLLGFDEIVLMFYNDQAGTEATAECVSLFPPDRVYIAALGTYKDACEALIAKDSEAIRQAIWNKKSYSPKSIVDGRDLFDLVSKPLHGKDADYPYKAVNEMTSGLRFGELVCLTSGSGVGKSTICGEISQALVDQNFRIGYIALEESVQRTALRLMSVVANKPLHLNNDIPKEELKDAFDKSIGTGQVLLRDGFGSVDPKSILNDMRYLVNQGVQWIILDHLSILLSANESNDERQLIDRTMTQLRCFVEETNIGMILVSHLRRSQSDKGHEDGNAISLSQLRGSGSIGQLSDICLGVIRSVSSGDNTSKVVCLKNRFNGQTGECGNLIYQKETGRLIEHPTALNTDYESF